MWPFKRRPKKYLILKFNDGFEPLRKARVLEVTEKTYLVEVNTYELLGNPQFARRYPDMRVYGFRHLGSQLRISKDDPMVVEVYER